MADHPARLVGLGAVPRPQGLAGGAGAPATLGGDAPLEPEDEWARLAQIKDRLWLESLSPDARRYILRQRQEEAEREARARAILEAERRAARNGETHPQEDPHENRLL
jgi:hypothetical protein